MSDLKKSWKKTAKSMLLAANDLGSSLFETAKAGYGAAMDWAKSDDNDTCVEAEGTEVPGAEEEAPNAE